MDTTERLSFHFILKSAEGCLPHPHPSCALEGALTGSSAWQWQWHKGDGSDDTGRLGAPGMVLTEPLHLVKGRFQSQVLT